MSLLSVMLTKPVTQLAEEDVSGLCDDGEVEGQDILEAPDKKRMGKTITGFDSIFELLGE